MIVEEPPIPLSAITEIPAQHRKKLANAGLHDFTQLFLHEGKLRSAKDLAAATNLSIREAIDVRQIGRKHLIAIITDIAAKRKVEPLELIWKLHWLIGIIPSGENRNEVVAQEAKALTTTIEAFENVDAQTVDKILVLLIHRTLFISLKETRAELERLIGTAEKFQRVSLLAYQLWKMKSAILAIVETEEPGQQITALRNVSAQWKKILQILQERDNVAGQNVVIARQAADSLAVLDLSEQHFKDRVQKTMPIKKLRQSQLTHITVMMNTLIELRDAYLVSTLADRASQIWFELAQGKPSKALTDDLLRSLRFARTAIFHCRALDDFNHTVKLLKHLFHLIGEFPSDIPKSLFEATTGAMKTYISTAPILDRPADEKIILEFLQSVQRISTTLQKQLPNREERKKFIQLQIEAQEISLTQLEQISTDSSSCSGVYRELIQSLLSLADTSTGEEQWSFLEKAVAYANNLLPKEKTGAQLIEQDMVTISEVTSHLSQFPEEDLSDAAKELMNRSYQLNEQLYFETRDPKIRAKLALQLLLSKLAPDSMGTITIPSSSKEFDKLEEYASKALVEHAKNKQKANALKAGSILVTLTLNRVYTATTEEQRSRLREQALDFANNTFSFMPATTEINLEEYPFAFLLLRSVNSLVHGEEQKGDSKWESILKQGEQLAQMMATAAAKSNDTVTQILALSIAATTTAELAATNPTTVQRNSLLTRAMTQIKKALTEAITIENLKTIKTIITQLDQIIRARLQIIPEIKDQIDIFTDWNNTLRQSVKALEKSDAPELTDWLHAYRLLNVEIPSVFLQLSHPTFSLDAAKRKVINFLQEVGKRGSQEQVELAKNLERRWTYQIGADSIITSGFRLEDAETSFTLADEQFRLSLQVNEQLEISENIIEKTHSFPFLRPSTQIDSLLWYDPTPVFCALFGDTVLLRWLAIDEPSENRITIRLWLIASHKISATYTLQIPTEEPPTKTQEGVTIQLSGGKLLYLGQPTAIEHQQKLGILINQISLEPGQPKPLAIQILLK